MDPQARTQRAVEAARDLERADQQSILDTLPALIAYWDRDLRNRLANRVYVEYFGMTPEEIFGRHISEVLGPELYRKNLQYLERALAGERQQFDREIPTPTGPRYTQALYLPDVHDGEVRGIFVLVTDISERRRAELALAQAEARFRTLFEAAPSATLMTDRSGVIVAANRAASRLFGHDTATLERMSIAELVHPDDLPAAMQLREDLFEGRADHHSDEWRYLSALGHTVWAQAEITVVQGAGPDDDAPYILAQLQDTSARKLYEEQLQYVADHDLLTGVLNRRGLTRVLERQAALAGERAGAVLVCDIDRFKAVNDRYGHKTGDELLVHLARLLERNVRATDAVGRLGGDEFAVVLPDLDLVGAQAVGAQIARLLQECDGDPERPWAGIPVSTSVGVAAFVADRSADQVLGEADRAMYTAKAARRAAGRDADDTDDTEGRGFVRAGRRP